MDTPREEKERQAKEHLAPGPGSRNQENGEKLARTREDGSGPRALADCCGRPIPQEGWKA